MFSTRLEGIHYINLPSSMQMLVSVVKTVLPEKMRKRVWLEIFPLVNALNLDISRFTSIRT